MTSIQMPQLGETIVEGTILKWLKQEGERIERDEPLFEISTDKVDTEVPSPVAGVVTKILVGEGETVAVGTLLAEVDAGDGAAEAEAVPSPASTSASSVPTATVSPSGTRIFVTTPATGEGTSVSTLSVEISSSGSSAVTVSPGCLSHFVIVPSETETPIWGMTTSTAVPVATA